MDSVLLKAYRYSIISGLAPTLTLPLLHHHGINLLFAFFQWFIFTLIASKLYTAVYAENWAFYKVLSTQWMMISGLILFVVPLIWISEPNTDWDLVIFFVIVGGFLFVGARDFKESCEKRRKDKSIT